MIIQMGVFFAGMLVGYFFHPRFIDNFYGEDVDESLSTNAIMVQPSNELLTLADSISNANFMKPPVESASVVKVQEPLSVDLCSKSSCLLEKLEDVKVQSKSPVDKNLTQSKNLKDVNLDDLVTSTPQGQSPVAIDTQMVTQSQTTFPELSTSTPPTARTPKKDNVEVVPKTEDKNEKVLPVNEKKVVDNPVKKKTLDKKAKKKVSDQEVNKVSDEKVRKEKLGSGSKKNESGPKNNKKPSSGSKKNTFDAKQDEIVSATNSSQPNQLSDGTKDMVGPGEKKLKRKKTKLSNEKKTRSKDAKKSKTKDQRKKKLKKPKQKKSGSGGASPGKRLLAAD